MKIERVEWRLGTVTTKANAENRWEDHSSVDAGIKCLKTAPAKIGANGLLVEQVGPASLPQYRLHLLPLRQFIDELIEIANLLHQRIFNLFDANTAHNTLD